MVRVRQWDGVGEYLGLRLEYGFSVRLAENWGWVECLGVGDGVRVRVRLVVRAVTRLAGGWGSADLEMQGRVEELRLGLQAWITSVNVFLRSNTCSNVFAFERKVENTFPLGVQTFF